MSTILELIGLIYDAVPNASRWQVFLEAFVRATGSRRGTFVLRDTREREFAVVCWVGWSAESIQLYSERYAAEDPWRVGTALMAEGEIGTNHRLCSDEEMHASRVFREFYGPHDCYYGFGGIVLRSETAQSAIIAQRGQADGPFGERELAILGPLMPHLRQAALLHGEWAAQQAQLATFTGHLDRYPHAFLLTDAECRVLYANAAARELAGRGDGLTLEDGKITAVTALSAAALRQAIQAIAESPNAPLRRLDVERSFGETLYRLLLLPVPNAGALPLGVARPAVALLIVDSESGPGPDPAVLRELFSLTAAEARIAEQLVLGRSAEEIAGAAGISLETVRTHIRRILSKTGTTRQAELISLVLRAAPFRRL